VAAAVGNGTAKDEGLQRSAKQHKIPPKLTFDETSCFCVSHCSCGRCSEQKQINACFSQLEPKPPSGGQTKNKKRRLCRVHNSRHGTVQQQIQ
jgi:hypothetical protein